MNKNILMIDLVNEMTKLIEHEGLLPPNFELEMIDQNIICRATGRKHLISIIFSPCHAYNQITIILDGMQIFVPRRFIKLKRNSLKDLLRYLESYGFSYREQMIVKQVLFTINKKSCVIKYSEQS